MRCSYCFQKGHSKRKCPVLPKHFAAFLEASKAIRSDYIDILKKNKIGIGTTFHVSNYGNILVRVKGIAPVNLFSTWAGGRTASSWQYLPLEKMKKISVEKCPEGPDGPHHSWVRLFSIDEIFNTHNNIELCETPFMTEKQKETWISCGEFTKPANMIAARGKPKASVFASTTHPYITKTANRIRNS